MKCRQCGAEISGGKFCAYCGARLRDVSAAEPDHKRKELLALLMKAHSLAEKCAPYFDEYHYLEGIVDVCSYRKYENKTWKIIFWVGLPFAILFGTPMLLFMGIIACIRVRNSGEKRNQRLFAHDQRQIQKARERQEQLAKEIQRIYDESGISQDYPIEYLHIDAVNEIYAYVNARRADTLKEAINLYEENCYRKQLYR